MNDSSGAIALAITGLRKAYVPGVPVLCDFDLELRAGEVLALIGSNGAGKSTLAAILTGSVSPDQGEILLHGQPCRPASKSEAAALGVIMVLQELNVIPVLSVAENLFLHRLPHRFGVVSRGQLRERARAALARVGLGAIDPDAPAGSLGVGQQQLVEIAGALAQKSSVLILDEPTAALTGPEIDLLFENISRLKREGVAILYISHRMDEIGRISDRVTVMRDGRRISTHRTDAVTVRQLVSEMANPGATGGGASVRSTGVEVPRARGEPGLIVRDLFAGQAVGGVNFTAHRGEILGIAGLIGSGRTETLRALFGADAIDGGSVSLGAASGPLKFRSPADAVRAGLALIPEDRRNDGILPDKSITVNASLATLARHAGAAGVVDEASEHEAVRAVCDRLALVRTSLDQRIDQLSGGNQQKVVVARWMLRDAEVFLFDEPTRGIDVAAKAVIYALLDELAAAGKTIVVVSSDLAELMEISHRILAMSAGRITGEFSPGSTEWSAGSITAACFSGYSEKYHTGGVA